MAKIIYDTINFDEAFIGYCNPISHLFTYLLSRAKSSDDRWIHATPWHGRALYGRPHPLPCIALHGYSFSWLPVLSVINNVQLQLVNCELSVEIGLFQTSWRAEATATEDKTESCLAKDGADLFQCLCSVKDRSLRTSVLPKTTHVQQKC